MTTTTMVTVSEADGWVSLATDPLDITVKANSPGKWHIAVAAAEPAADFEGEVYDNPYGDSWFREAVTGQVWIRVNGTDMSFAVII